MSELRVRSWIIGKPPWSSFCLKRHDYYNRCHLCAPTRYQASDIPSLTKFYQQSYELDANLPREFLHSSIYKNIYWALPICSAVLGSESQHSPCLIYSLVEETNITWTIHRSMCQNPFGNMSDWPISVFLSLATICCVEHETTQLSSKERKENPQIPEIMHKLKSRVRNGNSDYDSWGFD